MALYKYQVKGKTEKDYKEKKDQKLEADIDVIPNINYEVGQVHDIKGVGSAFSGTYKLDKVVVEIGPGGMTTQLKGHKVPRPKNPPSKKPSTSKEKAPTKKKADKVYIVRRGDTLSHIALRLTGKASNQKAIEEVNRTALNKRDPRNKKSPGHWIYPGQKITIPGNLLK